MSCLSIELSSQHRCMEDTWKMSSTTNVEEEIVKRFKITLSWLDKKRVQYRVEHGEESKIKDATTRKEKKFIPGWLNDEVRLN